MLVQYKLYRLTRSNCSGNFLILYYKQLIDGELFNGTKIASDQKIELSQTIKIIFKIIHMIIEKLKNLPRYFYRKQVQVEFPIPVLRNYVDYQWSLPEGYTLCSPGRDVDLQAWADLLNMDKQFGHWTPERIKVDILSNLIAPDAAALAFYKQQLVGCGNTIDCSSGKRKFGIGMWLMISESHRGTKDLAYAVTFRTLSYFAKMDYDKVVGFTDPERLSAIYLYLCKGCLPVYDSLSSFIHWYRINKRLKPALERAKRRQKNR